ncbi:MAG: ribonuclease J [Lachnospiraceae bacterium]|nr:ribonuclease J [Lachnospiraceae bacterium]
MNMTAFEYKDSIIVVDCGLAFPDDEMYGIDLVIPDTTYLEENLEKVKGFVITHGHEDHIGALPYVLRNINVPVFGTKLTIGIIENKLREHKMLSTTSRYVVKFGESIPLGDFRVEFIRTNHSIVDAAALAITTEVGTVIHTGDFKVDYTPVFGDAIDLQRFAQLGMQGVLALLCDSTNSDHPGYTQSEKTVGKTIDRLFHEHENGRIIIATFASNVDRVQQIINSAHKHGRKVVIDGRSMVNVIETAQELKRISIPANTLVDVEMLKNIPDKKTVIITTGSQGESMAALSRMADDTHRKVTIKPGDTIIFSSHPIPGNEKAVTSVINKLSEKGADVIFQDVHVSGHPCQEEVKLIYSLVRPKYSVPVHGEFRHLRAQADLAADLGIPKEHIFLLRSGDVLEINQEHARQTDHVHVGSIMVDGTGVGDVGNAVLRDRQHLAEDGVIFVSLAVEDGVRELVAGPEIISRGVVYQKLSESEELMEEARDAVYDTVMQCLLKDMDNAHIVSAVKDTLTDFFWKRTKWRPMVLTTVLDV